MRIEEDILLKVCGMRDPENIKDVLSVISPDMMGFIFYNQSPRYLDAQIPADLNVKKVGVFVNEDPNEIIRIAKEYSLDYVQFHGDEEMDSISTVKTAGFRIIKAIGVNDHIDFDQLKMLEHLVDYFLFDTKSEKYGGTGSSFDWKILESYDLDTPYFLSGGLNPESIELIDLKKLSGLAGIDVNSGFEIHPGLKDVNKLKLIRK